MIETFVYNIEHKNLRVSNCFNKIFNLFLNCEIISQNPFIVNIYFSIGIIFAFIPHLILKYRIKKSTNNNMNKANTASKLNIDLIYEDISENFSSKKFRYLLLSSVGSFLQILLFNLFSICGFLILYS